MRRLLVPGRGQLLRGGRLALPHAPGPCGCLWSSSASPSSSSSLLRHRVVAVGGAFAGQRREYKCPVPDIKKGWVIEHLGRLWEVVNVSQSRKTAQRRAHIMMELRDLAAGSKKNERFRVEDRIETVILDVENCTYSRSEGKTLIFRHDETGEEVSVRKDLVGATEFYLEPGISTAKLSVYNGEAVSARLPRKAVVTLKDAESTQSIAAGYKKATLDNGRSIRVPPFLVPGDVIIISLPSEEYIGKSDGTEIDEDEDDEDDEDDEEEVQK